MSKILKNRKVTARFTESEFTEMNKYIIAHPVFRNISQLVVRAVLEKLNEDLR